MTRGWTSYHFRNSSFCWSLSDGCCVAAGAACAVVAAWARRGKTLSRDTAATLSITAVASASGLLTRVRRSFAARLGNVVMGIEVEPPEMMKMAMVEM